MLNKYDLVKQFEDIVKQEIKNHNDSILATNIAINRLEKMINDVIVDLDSRFNEVRNESLNKYHFFNRQFVDQNYNYQELQKDISNIHTFIKDLYSKIEKELIQKTDKKEYDIELKQLRAILEQKIDKIHESMEKDKSCCIESNRTLKKQVDYIPGIIRDYVAIESSNNEKKHENLEKEFKLAKIEKEGLLKEIEVLKKQSFIQEKKIEDLYFLINKKNR